MPPSSSTSPSAPGVAGVAIIGSGFSGLCLGILLKQAGIHDFVILEKAASLGGTWRDNTYPGAACDTPAFGYCFSFEQKTDWSRKWAPQSEILDYMEHCARKYGLGPHLRFRAEVERAEFDESAACWRVRLVGGEEIRARALVSGTGQLNRPAVPKIAGLESFRGRAFHSARWEHDFDPKGRRVAVVGNAASAIQLIPELAKQAGELRVFQRSANWMLPRMDRPYGEAEKARFARHPWLAKLYRWWIWGMHELRFPVFRGHGWLGRRMQELSLRAMRQVVRDPKLQDALVPAYPIGGKRILISDDYYAALNREHVHVVTSAIDHVEADAIVTRDGQRFPVDAIVLATGFDSTSFLAPMEIRGLGGRSLREAWQEKGGAHAYLGITVPGFPNFFMMYGPNTNLGHNSIIFMLECQAGYIVQALRLLRERGLRWLDLRPEVMEAHRKRLEQELSRTVWARTDHSWYKTADGTITNNWSGTTTRYWWATRRFDRDAYEAR